MKNIFAKTIDTGKVDHFSVFKKALSDVLEVALKNVPLAAIALEMESRAAHFRRTLEGQAEARLRATHPVMYDPLTNKPINSHRQAARAEEERNAKELARQQAEYAADVDARARREMGR